MPSTPSRIFCTSIRPEFLPLGRSIWVTSPVTTVFELKPKSGQEHLHLFGRGVLRLVEDDEGVVQRAAAHERERSYFDIAALDELVGLFGLDHVVQARHGAAGDRG